MTFQITWWKGQDC